VAEGTAEAAPEETSTSTSSAASSTVPQKRAVSPSASPAPVVRQAPSTRPASSSPHFVEVDGGFLIQRVVPDDNSCLFHAAGLALSQHMPDAAASLRRVVAGAIQADPETWSEVVLGCAFLPPSSSSIDTDTSFYSRSAQSYIETILSPKSWGGAVELAVLAAHFSSEIWSLDVQTGRVDQFGEGQGFETFCLLVYSGIRAFLAAFSDASSSSD
jgi:ubiquitin thioesterase OTU1